MDKKKKKEMLGEWKLRKPEIGIVAIKSKSTGEIFLDTSLDTSVSFNRHKFQLELGNHPNKRLSELWKNNGEDDMEYLIVDTLEYEDNPEDNEEELEIILMECMDKMEKADLLDIRKKKKLKLT